MCGDGDDDEIDGLVEFGEAAECGPAEDGFAAAVDEVDGAVIGHTHGLDTQPVAVLGFVVACAKYRNAFRVEQGGEVAGHGWSSTGGTGYPVPQASAPPSMRIVVPVM